MSGNRNKFVVSLLYRDKNERDSENINIRVTYGNFEGSGNNAERDVKYAEDQAEHSLQKTDSDCLLAHEESKKQ